MTTDEVKKLKNGVYRIHWADGGSSVAAVGRLHDGRVWMAPSNWVAKRADGIATEKHWHLVEKMELLATQEV